MKTYPFYQRITHLQKMFLVGHVAVPPGTQEWHFAAHQPPQSHIMASEHDYFTPNICTDEIVYQRIKSPIDDMTMYVADVELQVT